MTLTILQHNGLCNVSTVVVREIIYKADKFMPVLPKYI